MAIIRIWCNWFLSSAILRHFYFYNFETMPWIYWAHKIWEIAQNVENYLAAKRKRENQKERRFMVQCIIDYYSMKRTIDFINRMPFVVLFPVILARVLRKSNQRIDGSDVYKIEIKKAYKVQCVRCSFNLCANECFLFWKKLIETKFLTEFAEKWSISARRASADG